MRQEKQTDGSDDREKREGKFPHRKVAVNRGLVILNIFIYFDFQTAVPPLISKCFCDKAVRTEYNCGGGEHPNQDVFNITHQDFTIIGFA